MALSTYETIWKAVVLRCPPSAMFLARQWVSYAFRQVAERRRWSWLTGRGQFLMNAVVNTGTVTVNRGDLTVTGSGTAWDGSLINRQFRVGLQVPIYDIVAVDDVNQTLDLSEPWGGDPVTSIGYQIYNAYVTVPTDFHSFISVWDPRMNWQLWLNVRQDQLNAIDAQRSAAGTAYVVSPYPYSSFDNPPLPRYEIWPHQKAAYAYPFLYESRPPDLEDPGASLPRYIRGDVLLEMALAQAARWPGPDNESRNPYFNLNLAMQHEARAEKMIYEMERADDEVSETDVMYQDSQGGLQFAPFSIIDSRWMQSHA